MQQCLGKNIYIYHLLSYSPRQRWWGEQPRVHSFAGTRGVLVLVNCRRQRGSFIHADFPNFSQCSRISSPFTLMINTNKIAAKNKIHKLALESLISFSLFALLFFFCFMMLLKNMRWRDYIGFRIWKMYWVVCFRY